MSRFHVTLAANSALPGKLLVLLFVWLATATSGISLNPAFGSEQPNIILIFTDDIGYNEFGFTAAHTNQTSRFQTPRLDDLAQESVYFTNAYATGAVCSPSRAGLLTGLYPQRFGYEDNISSGTTGATDGLRAGQATIANTLQGLGYTTGALGKWHLGTTDAVNRPHDVGFDEFYGFLGGDRSYYRYTGGVRLDQVLRRGNTSIESTWAFEGEPSHYDPVHGRYLTDALAEEAVSFIDRHAESDNPFFLYVAFNATHTPYQFKQQDYAHFAHIENEAERQLAAMSYALDRAVGTILDAVQAKDLDDNTVIVFANDNGGVFPDHDNAPYWGHKGSMFEGGIRVPLLIRAPELESAVYDRAVSMFDLLPTFVSFAGGDTEELVTDGVDLIPYVQGDANGDPHEKLFWRGPSGRFAVRKGDWKLVRPDANPFARLHNLATDPSERTYLNAQQPTILADLVRELTYWEVQLEKPTWGALGARNKNEFDHFVFRGDQASLELWSHPNAWTQGGTSSAVRLTPEDAYANAILEFRTNDTHDYTATNDMLRATRYTFMLNEMRFTGDFDSMVGRRGTINGNSLLMVKSLSGQSPRLRMDAVAVPEKAHFEFILESDLELFDDLEITGDGTQSLVISGAIRDYHMSRGILKLGSSQVIFKGEVTSGGPLVINQGKVTLDDPIASIHGASQIVVGVDGEFDLSQGVIAVETIDNSAGGVFRFRGGRLSTVNVLGDLTNEGGVYAPSASPSLSSIVGDFTQTAGSLEIDIGGIGAGTDFDVVEITGEAALGGLLEVKLINAFVPSYGQTFPFLIAGGGIFGEFEEMDLPQLTGNMQWSILRTEGAISLVAGLPGDYNLDGKVDASDYTVWRDSLGQQTTFFSGADGDGDGMITMADYELWRTNFGNTIASAATVAKIPEPRTVAMMLIGLVTFPIRRIPRGRSPNANDIVGQASN